MGNGKSTLEDMGLDMDWQRYRVLVTGATGMVGSWLVKRLLHEGAYVVTLVRDWDPQTELIRSGDIRRTSVINGALEDYWTVERAINEHEIDTVFHLGAQTIVGTALRSPLPTFESNIRGTYNLLEACRVHRDFVLRVVVASSDKAYGESETLPYTEDMVLDGRHPYDVSKSCACRSLSAGLASKPSAAILELARTSSGVASNAKVISPALYAATWTLSFVTHRFLT